MRIFFVFVKGAFFPCELSIMKNTRHVKADTLLNGSIDLALHNIKTHHVKLLFVHIEIQTVRNDLLINYTIDIALKIRMYLYMSYPIRLSF